MEILQNDTSGSTLCSSQLRLGDAGGSRCSGGVGGGNGGARYHFVSSILRFFFAAPMTMKAMTHDVHQSDGRRGHVTAKAIKTNKKETNLKRKSLSRQKINIGKGGQPSKRLLSSRNLFVVTRLTLPFLRF